MTIEKYPETIYLMEDPEWGAVWCDDPDPAGMGDDAPEAVEYLRHDKAGERLGGWMHCREVARRERILEHQRDELAKALGRASNYLEQGIINSQDDIEGVKKQMRAALANVGSEH